MTRSCKAEVNAYLHNDRYRSPDPDSAQQTEDWMKPDPKLKRMAEGKSTFSKGCPTGNCLHNHAPRETCGYPMYGQGCPCRG